MTTTTLIAVAERYREPIVVGNAIRDLNPIVLLVVLASIAVIGVALPGWIPPLAVSVVFVIIGFLAGKGPSFLATYLKLWAAVGIILFVLRALLIKGETVLVPLGPIAITAEGINDGLRFTFVVMAICGAVTLFFALVPMRRLTLALEKLGVSPKASYVLLASFQSITDLGATAKVVLDAQKARGIETEGNIFIRTKAFFPVLAPVFLSAMSATEERAIALDARAFNSRGTRTSLVTLPRTAAWQWILACVFIIAAVVAITGGILGWFSQI